MADFRVIHRFEHEVLTHKELPEDAGCLARFEVSAVFQSFITCVIILNTISLAMQADHPRAEVWDLFDDIFLWIYTFELLLRLAVYRWSFFVNSDWRWNWFDFAIVVFGLFYELVMTSNEGTVGKLVMAMRMMRILRILRAFKIFIKFPALKRLVTALVSSLGTVFWIALFFFVLILVYAIFVTVIVKPNLDQFEDPDQVEEWFGSIYNSMVTLWIYLTLDDWSDSARTVNEKFPVLAFVWITYIILGAFMILSLLTGAMCDKMAAARAEMDEEESSQDVEEIEAQLSKFRERFHDGKTLDVDEFCAMVEEADMAQVLDRCGVKVTSAEGRRWLFRSIDRDGDDKLTWDEFHEALTDIGNHRDKTAALRELLWMEGKVASLDKRLEQEHHRSCRLQPAVCEWEDQLDDVHARSSFLHSRLKSLEDELQAFFEFMRSEPQE